MSSFKALFVFAIAAFTALSLAACSGKEDDGDDTAAAAT